MRRYVPLVIAGLAMIAAACSDVTAPASSSESDLSVVSTSAADKRDHRSRVHHEKFDIPAAGGRLRVGDFWLTFPANAVCEPNHSGYGSNFWDRPCETLTTDFTVDAKYFWNNGEAIIEFSPDIRFDPAKTVLISTFRPALIGKTDVGGFEISSWSNSARHRVQEHHWDDDESLVTLFDPVTGEVSRRVLHFSGISISSGMLCDDTVGDPDCVPLGDSF